MTRNIWLMLLVSLFCHTAGGWTAVRLCQRAGVATDNVRLSDLLPVGAPAFLHEKASEVLLGRSPQLGSARIFQAQQIAQAMATKDGLPGQLLIPDQVTVVRLGIPISRERIHTVVASFLAKKGLQQYAVDSLQLNWSQEATALVPAPALEVASLGRGRSPHEINLAVRCVDRKICGTSLVSAVVTDEAFAHANLSNVRSRPKMPAAILVRAGQLAMLTWDNHTLHVSVQVVCLQRGASGQTIRAREMNGHRVFRAKVTGAAKLQAIL